MARCDIKKELAELVWEQFKGRVLDKVVKKTAKKVAFSAGVALLDSPAPGPADFVAAIYAIYSITSGVIGFGECYREYKTTKKLLETVLSREIKKYTQVSGEGWASLNECQCDCFKKYLRDFAKAGGPSVNKKAKRRARKKSLRDLGECMIRCA